MAVIFVSTGVSTGLMVDKMMKVAPGGLVVPLLPKQTQLQVQNPRLDVDFGVFIAEGDQQQQKEPLWIWGVSKHFLPYNPGIFLATSRKTYLYKKIPKKNNSCFGPNRC